VPSRPVSNTSIEGACTQRQKGIEKKRDINRGNYCAFDSCIAYGLFPHSVLLCRSLSTLSDFDSSRVLFRPLIRPMLEASGHEICDRSFDITYSPITM